MSVLMNVAEGKMMAWSGLTRRYLASAPASLSSTLTLGLAI